MRGGEKVLEALCKLYPQADIYTHVYDPENISEAIKKHQIKTTFIQRLPRAIKWYQNYLPLMPLALWFLNLKKYDLVISSESGPAKGVQLNKEAMYICYCHSPMRYVWDLFDEYFRSVGLFKRMMMLICTKPLRIWDRWTSRRVNQFIANSTTVQKRILECYQRDSVVIHPPVDIDSFGIQGAIGDYYLLFGQLIQYKRPDLAVEAFNHSGRKLIVIGQGGMLDSLRKLAKPNVQFLGRLDDVAIKGYLAHCRALIFPGLEDFGIVPVEVMACGRPVIAFGQGGVLDTVINEKTGVYFKKQTVQSLNEAIDQYEKVSNQFNPEAIREWAHNFSKEKFQSQFKELTDRLMMK
jgi:glycosyltransferase involved in cell wall biosynthesis